MSLVLKVACPSCDYQQDSLIGTEVRCRHCGNDFRALGHGESSTRIVSATPDDLEHVPYSKRSTDVPRSSASSQILSDPALLDDLLLRDLPMRENARWAGKVRLVKKLGQGGMGAVYRGVDDSMALEVAVKVLPIPPGGREMHFADRFRQEARISANISSPNVVRTLNIGENGSVVYIVMDFIDGQTARQLLDRKGLIPVPQALQIVHDAALGMQAAHERSIVHRDIKPENILVANDGRVLLADLGLAKASGSRIADSILPITRMGLLLGTPEYMSPEQWDIGAHITPRSDIWSMGVTLWVLLTRRTPFDDSDIGQLSKKIKEAPLPDIRTLRPDVPDQVSSILFHCMAKNPQRRYMNAAALVSALNSAMLHPEQADDEYSTPPSTSGLSISTSTGSYQVARSAGVTPPPVLVAQPKSAPNVTPIATPVSKPPIPAVARTQTPAPVKAATPSAPAQAPQKSAPSKTAQSVAAQKAAPTPIAASKTAAPVQPATKIASIVPPYVEPPRAMPTPIVASPKSKSAAETTVRKKKTTLTRKLAWMSIPAAAAAAVFAVYHFGGLNGLLKPTSGSGDAIALAVHPTVQTNTPEVAAKPTKLVTPSEPEVTLDVRAPKRVKAGEKPILSASVKGDDPTKYDIVWSSGKEEAKTGSEITALFERDKEFDIKAVLISNCKEVAHTSIRVEVDLTANAIDVASADPDAPTRFEGSVGGGPGIDKTEVRWVDSKNPNESLCDKWVFEPNLKDAKTGSQKIYVFQARRKGARDWSGAPSDKVAVVIQAKVPAAFTQAMKDADRLLKEAENAETGSAAQLALADAQEFCERAQQILPENKDAQHLKGECLRRARAEATYARNMSESHEKYIQAEQSGSDYYTKQTKLEEALQPCLAAKNTLEANDIHIHQEAKAEITRLEGMIQACKDVIRTEKLSLAEFASRRRQARESVNEANKYQSLSVALPHWEKACDTFNALRKQYPKLAADEGFKLELHKAHENYLKAYLFVKAGFVPGRPEDAQYQKQAGNPPSNSAQPSNPQAPSNTQRRTIPDP